MLIDINNLAISLGGVPVLRDVRLSLREGEIYGLIGPNGAGKSTTIAATVGLLKTYTGRVRLFGQDPRLAANECHERLGVLPEQNNFYGWMSAEEYLSYFAALYGRHPEPNEIKRKFAHVGLDPRPGQTIETYSRGMRQRLGLARALVSEPKLLVLDEPTNGLDPRGRREIHDILLGLAHRGVGILLCTHILDDVDRLCRRVGIIVEGRTVAEGTIADLIRNEHRLARYRLRLAGEPPTIEKSDDHVSVVAHEGEWWIVDLDPAVTPDAAWRELFFRGWPISEVRREGGGLEDLYLTLTERRSE